MDDSIESARRYALRLLARRDYSAQEIKDKLSQRNFTIDVIDAMILDLQTEGSQSDERFCEAYIRYRSKLGFGPLRLKQELAQKGVASDLIQTCLEAAECDWDAMAEMVLCKKFNVYAPQDFKIKMKQKSFLQYRGFNQEQIVQATEKKYESSAD